MFHTIELTEQQAKILDEVMEKVEKIKLYLAGLSYADRLNWLKEHQYPHPISFEHEISGTVYTVNAHFSNGAAETVEEKAKRILNHEITH